MRRRDSRNINLNCTFCGKSQRDVAKLVAGPMVYVCDQCAKELDAELGAHIGQERPPTFQLNCGFCGKTKSEVTLIERNKAAICRECVDLVLDIVAEERRAEPRTTGHRDDADALAERFRLPLIDTRQVTFRRDVVELIPKAFALEHRVLATERRGPFLTVAMIDPTKLDTIRAIEELTKLRVQVAVTWDAALESALAMLYPSWD